jgi:hypothetical protein
MQILDEVGVNSVSGGLAWDLILEGADAVYDFGRGLVDGLNSGATPLPA